jgi:hypothetical protein
MTCDATLDHGSRAGQRLPFSFLHSLDCSLSTPTIHSARSQSSNTEATYISVTPRSSRSSRRNGQRPCIARTLSLFAVVAGTSANFGQEPSLSLLTAYSSTTSHRTLPRFMSDMAMAVLGSCHGLCGTLTSVRYFRHLTRATHCRGLRGTLMFTRYFRHLPRAMADHLYSLLSQPSRDFDVYPLLPPPDKRYPLPKSPLACPASRVIHVHEIACSLFRQLFARTGIKMLLGSPIGWVKVVLGGLEWPFDHFSNLLPRTNSPLSIPRISLVCATILSMSFLTPSRSSITTTSSPKLKELT